MRSGKRATAREEGKEKKEERREMVRSQKGGMVEKRVGPRERGGKGAKRSEKRDTNTIKMRGSKKTISIISSTEKRQERR